MTTEPLTTDTALDSLLSTPSPRLVEMMRRLQGDVMVLGVAGKMGITLAMMARRAMEIAARPGEVIGVARFSDAGARELLESSGVRTIACDLLERKAVAALPVADNVVFMAGRKFGTDGDEDATWALNVLVPGNVAHRFRGSRTVVFSTGCVYPFVSAGQGGCDENAPVEPLGEYAQSCLGRERVFEFHSKRDRTPVCILRLNYAIDLRYGVLHDIGRSILEGRPVRLSVGHFNCIWQGDANNQALLALEHAASPATVLNITGPETVAVRDVARDLARALGREVTFDGEEIGTAYLSDARRAHRLFGRPEVSIEQMVRWTADWLLAGGRSLDKPTHFEVRNGRY